MGQFADASHVSIRTCGECDRDAPDVLSIVPHGLFFAPVPGGIVPAALDPAFFVSEALRIMQHWMIHSDQENNPRQSPSMDNSVFKAVIIDHALSPRVATRRLFANSK